MTSLSEPDLRSLKEIFFLCSSRKNFASEIEKESFFETWVGYYLKNCLTHLFLAQEGDRVLGYLTGCADSIQAREYYRDRLKAYFLFEDLFVQYPAHLHINCHPDAQGKGLGGELIESFVESLEEEQLKGVHLVTSPDAKNVRFYRKHRFDFECTRELDGYCFLFMGRAL